MVYRLHHCSDCDRTALLQLQLPLVVLSVIRLYLFTEMSCLMFAADRGRCVADDAQGSFPGTWNSAAKG